MPERTLSNPQVQIDNDTIGIIPNSLSYKLGKGDKNLRPQSAGNNSIEMITTENAETKKSMVKFSLYNTKTNIEIVKNWQDAVDGVTILLSDGDLNESFIRMHITADPEWALGADGNAELNFEGPPSV